MKKIIVSIAILFGCYTQAFAVPVLGTHNLADGIKLNFDANGDGCAACVGDHPLNRATDWSWVAYGATIATKTWTPFVSTDGGLTASRTSGITATGAVLSLDGSTIWGQPSGSTYMGHSTGAMSTATAYYHTDGTGGWIWDYSEGHVTGTGLFDIDPMAYVLEFDFVMDTYIPATGSVAAMLGGTISNVRLTVMSVPLPPALWLMGIGLLGLMAANTRRQRIR